MRFLSALFPSLNEDIEDQSLDYVVFTVNIVFVFYSTFSLNIIQLVGFRSSCPYSTHVVVTFSINYTLNIIYNEKYK